MKISRTSTLIGVVTFGITGAALDGALAPDGDPPGSSPPNTAMAQPTGDPGVSATQHFTDARGNPRNPTAAEARAAAAAFRNDLQRLAGPHAGRVHERTVPSGAIAATVATSQLALLYAVGNEDGTVAIGHTTSDGDSKAPPEPTNSLPEK